MDWLVIVRNIVNLTPTQRLEAVEYAETVEGRVVGPNYTGLEMDDRFFVGRIGELAFMAWAAERFIRFEETVRDDGKPDDQDFFVWSLMTGRKVRVSVKNSHHPRARFMMQPVSQDERRGHYDIYIGMTGKDDGTEVEVTLHGAATRAQWLSDREVSQRRVLTYQLALNRFKITMSTVAAACEKTE